MESNSLDKIINLKKEKLNSLKSEYKIDDLNKRIDNFDKFFDFKKSIENNKIDDQTSKEKTAISN